MIRGLGNLYRSVIARWTSETDSSWEVVSDTPSDTPAPESTAVPEQAPLQTASECRANGFVPELVLDRQVQLDLLATSDLTALGRYWHPALEFLYTDPDFENSPTQPDIRISRAVRAGVSARQKLAGSVRFTVKSPRLPARISNEWYVCLRGPQHPAGFITQDYPSYRSAVSIANSGRFHPGGVSHSFGTQAEVLAYLAGAGVQWPPDL